MVQTWGSNKPTELAIASINQWALGCTPSANCYDCRCGWRSGPHAGKNADGSRWQILNTVFLSKNCEHLISVIPSSLIMLYHVSLLVQFWCRFCWFPLHHLHHSGQASLTAEEETSTRPLMWPKTQVIPATSASLLLIDPNVFGTHRASSYIHK